MKSRCKFRRVLITASFLSLLLSLLLCILLGAESAAEEDPDLLFHKTFEKDLDIFIPRGERKIGTGERPTEQEILEGLRKAIIFQSVWGRTRVISVFDEAGDVIDIFQLTGRELVGPSRSGKYLGVSTYPQDASGDRVHHFSVMTPQGQVLWETDVPKLRMGFRVSDDGRAIGAWTRMRSEIIPYEKSEIFFYDKDGSLLGSMECSWLRSAGFSPEGNIYLVSDSDGLAMYDQEAKKLWALDRCYDYVTSSEAQYTVTNWPDNGSPFIRFYKAGRLIGTYELDLRYPRMLVIDSEGTYAAIIDDYNLYMFSVPTAQLLWRYHLSSPQLSFTSVDMIDNTRVIAGVEYTERDVDGRKRHTKGYIYLFGSGGDLIWQKEITYERWNIEIPIVMFYPTTDCAMVLALRDIYLFDISNR